MKEFLLDLAGTLPQPMLHTEGRFICSPSGHSAFSVWVCKNRSLWFLWPGFLRGIRMRSCLSLLSKAGNMAVGQNKSTNLGHPF